jgi:hypothetical protein
MFFDLAVPPAKPAFVARGQSPARLIAFYLPQFHPVPENDAFWGKGFTEWSNVKKAEKLFPGHLQPRRPGPLGYYDLRDPGIRAAQADLARNAGIEGFCYWHYWFGAGRTILDRPFNEVLASGQPAFPFCLAWANESWTGIWHGAPHRILIEQTYPGPADQEGHFRTLLPAFRDPRYLTVDGCPIFLIYRPESLPDTFAFAAQWRRLAENAGLPGLHLIGMSNDFSAPCLTPFDAIMPYGPRDFLAGASRPRLLNRLGRRFLSGPTAQRLAAKIPLPWLPTRYDYADLARSAVNDLPRTKKFIPCLLAGWDNTPRAGRAGIVLENFSPALFRTCLQKALTHVAAYPPAEKLIFIKAWNEWAEGNFLEPDEYFGTALLDTVRETMREDTQAAGISSSWPGATPPSTS